MRTGGLLGQLPVPTRLRPQLPQTLRRGPQTLRRGGTAWRSACRTKACKGRTKARKGRKDAANARTLRPPRREVRRQRLWRACAASSNAGHGRKSSPSCVRAPLLSPGV